jgi:NADH-quinone oxidoreductase subunit E
MLQGQFGGSRIGFAQIGRYQTRHKPTDNRPVLYAEASPLTGSARLVDRPPGLPSSFQLSTTSRRHTWLHRQEVGMQTVKKSVDLELPVNKDSADYAARILRDVNEVVDLNTGKSGRLIRVLQQSQERVGYLPPEVLTAISQVMKVPISEVNGVVSFYNFFTTVPRGKYVLQVCLGTACYVRGGQRILDILKREYKLEPGDTTPDGILTLDTVRCLGACALAPVSTLNGQVHRRVKPTTIRELVSRCR